MFGCEKWRTGVHEVPLLVGRQLGKCETCRKGEVGGGKVDGGEAAVEVVEESDVGFVERRTDFFALEGGGSSADGDFGREVERVGRRFTVAGCTCHRRRVSPRLLPE